MKNSQLFTDFDAQTIASIHHKSAPHGSGGG